MILIINTEHIRTIQEFAVCQRFPSFSPAFTPDLRGVNLQSTLKPTSALTSRFDFKNAFSFPINKLHKYILRNKHTCIMINATYEGICVEF